MINNNRLYIKSTVKSIKGAVKNFVFYGSHFPGFYSLVIFYFAIAPISIIYAPI